MKRVVIALLALSGLIFFTTAAYFSVSYFRFIEEPMASPQSFDYEVKRGSNVRSIAADLVQRGWLDDDLFLRVLARHQALTEVKIGLYAFAEAPTPKVFLQRINSGKVKQFSITFPEGWTYRQWLDELARHPKISKTLPSDVPYQEHMELLGSSYTHPEGWFFPETYFYQEGTSDLEILQRAHEKMQDFLQAAWESNPLPLPLENPYQVLTLASIIEKETGAPHERAAIAGVFMRRLERNMRLETDPTVIYGIGESFDGNITRKHLRTPTPYNTYVIKGLPPTPIAMPSAAAILAVFLPEEDDTLFFVSKGDGTHHFSATLDEHNRAVRQYQLKK